MAIDGADHDVVVDKAPGQDAAKSRIATRQTKPLKRSASALSNHADSKATSNKPVAAAASRRPALAQKRANTFAGTKATTTIKTTPQAVRAARRRREAAEAKHLAALAELEEAKRQEEQELEQHRAKKLKTSEPEATMVKGEDDEDDEELDEDELAALEEEDTRVSKWETEVEGGARAKDEGWEDLDAGDEEDPLMVSAYVVEVYDYLRELEVRREPSRTRRLAL